MKKLACNLLVLLTVSGCAVAGKTYSQYPADLAGWNISSETNYENDRVKTAEFPCIGYKYKLIGGIVVSDYHWFGPPFLPILPPFFAGGYSPDSGRREFDLRMEGKHADTFICPIIKLNADEYKGEAFPSSYNEHLDCRYSIPTPTGILTFFIEDQMGCKLPPLKFKLTPEWYYHPIFPGTGY